MIKTILAVFLSVSLLFSSAKAQISFSSGTIPTGIPTSGIPSTIRWLPGDFDGDGDVDVLYQSGNTSATNIFYLENDGAGNYSSTAASGGTFGSGPFSGISFTLIANSIGVPVMHIADYDNDGDIDIFELSTASSRFLKNDGGAWSVATLPANFPVSVVAPLRWIPGDYDGDGDVDVLYQTGNTNNTGIFYLENDGSGSFTSTAATGGTFASGPFNGITFVLIGGAYGQYLMDVDGDGDKDIFELGTASSRLLVSNGSSYSVAGAIPANFPASAVAPGRWLPGDYDGDGDIDVLYQTTNTSGSGINYIQNNGAGSFTSIAATGGTFGSGPFNGVAFTLVGPTGNPLQHIMDVDADGDLDVLELSSTSTRALLASGTAPAISSSTPADDDTDFSPGDNITLNFNQAVTAGSGNIYIKRSSDNSIVQTIAANSVNVSGSGTATIVIDPTSDLDASTAYYLNFDRYAFVNANGVVFGELNHLAKLIEPITSATYLNFSTSSTLPVTLTLYTAKLTAAGGVLISWQTADEANSSHFIIGRSTDGVGFVTIGRVAAKGNSSLLTNYSFTDNNRAAGTVYYRLLQYDLDGRKTDYGIRTVKGMLASTVSVYSNPASKEVLVKWPPATGSVKVMLVNAAGQIVYNKQFAASPGTLPISTSNMSKGIYTLVVSGDNIYKATQVVVAP